MHSFWDGVPVMATRTKRHGSGAYSESSITGPSASPAAPSPCRSSSGLSMIWSTVRTRPLGGGRRKQGQPPFASVDRARHSLRP